MTPSKESRKFSGISLRWAQHLRDETARLKFNQLVVRTLREPVLLRLLDLVKQELDHNTYRDPDYSNPAWSHEQAHMNGKRQAYQDLIKLLTVTDHD